MEITPFTTSDQSPIVQIYGMPHDTSPDIVPPGALRISLNQDLTNNFSYDNNTREQLKFDGETYRITFSGRYGIAPRLEIGAEIPYIIQGGGFLDTFIINWHNTFWMHQSRRLNTTNDRLNYSYVKDGVTKIRIDKQSSGIGDISLLGGFSIYDSGSGARHDRIALKAALKIPTGQSSLLLGSGSTDFSLQLCGSMNIYTRQGSLGVFGSVGALAISGGDVLSDQINPLVGVGTLGFGWGPNSRISFKVQLNGHTPFYHDSELAELSKNSLSVITGGTVKLPWEYLLDIGVAENLELGTAPDVSFHLGLTKQY